MVIEFDLYFQTQMMIEKNLLKGSDFLKLTQILISMGSVSLIEMNLLMMWEMAHSETSQKPLHRDRWST